MAFVQQVLQASCIIVPSPLGWEKKGCKPNGSENSQRAGRSGSSWAVNEVALAA